MSIADDRQLCGRQMKTAELHHSHKSRSGRSSECKHPGSRPRDIPDAKSYRHVSLGRTILCSMHRHRSYRGPSLLCTKPMCLGCLLLKYYPHRVLINNDRCAHALCRNFAWRRSPDTKHAAPLLYRKSASQVAVFLGSWPE
jgi:hypothetical protein